MAVCIFHFTNGNDKLLPEADSVRYMGSFGWLGVQIFFVISGFVIPYSLYLRNYILKDTGGFLLRRLKRIEPPYFASILMVVALNFFVSRVPGFRGEPFHVSPIQLAAHIAYLNAILNYGWLNPVYWTLAIEFQYYLFVALVFPLLNSPSLTIRMACVLGVSLLSILVRIENDNLSQALLPHWLPLFAIGMLTFQFIVGHFRPLVFMPLLGVLAGICWSVLGPSYCRKLCLSEG